MATQYYKIDSRRVSFAEYWRMTPDFFTFLVVAGLKLFGRQVAMGSGMPAVDRLHTIEAREVPRRVRSMWAEALRACADAGITPQMSYTVPALGVDKETYGAALHGEGGLITGQVLYSREGTTENSLLALYTWLSDGRGIITSSAPKKMDDLPGALVVRLPKKPMADVVARHRERAFEAGTAAVKIAPQKLEASIIGMERRVADWYVERGLWVPMTPAEVAALGGPPFKHATSDFDLMAE